MQCTSDGDAVWYLYINNVLVNKKRNWLNTHENELNFKYPYILNAGDVVEIRAQNHTRFGTTNALEVFLYGNEY
jgi:hypothetical protein